MTSSRMPLDGSPPAFVDTVPAPTPVARPPRASSTLVLVRDGPTGPEVLLLRRDDRGDRSGGAWVFPGGLVDRGDRECRALCTGPDDIAASARMNIPAGGLDFMIAALRETFEECGLLLAVDARGHSAGPFAANALQDWRAPMTRKERSLQDLCTRNRLTLDTDRLAYISHWVTPVGYDKRFDVRFFVAEAPAGQDVRPDGVEVLEHMWLRPQDALSQEPPLKLMNPTRKTLSLMAQHSSAAAVMAWARVLARIPRVQPHVGIDAHGPRPVNPDEPAWAELRRLDPLGTSPARCDIVPGLPVRLSRRVIRVTAPNAGMMTGPGTNTYLVGTGHADDAQSHWAVIDPGPDDPVHVRAVVAAAPGPIRWIIVTHTHLDHSPAANALRAETGAPVFGRRPDHFQFQDETFKPDFELEDGQRLELGPATTLRTIHTPGHASNHLCFVLEQEHTLFTGDHVMQGSTVVIAPPDGDMRAYLASLRRLLRNETGELEWLAPGHGFLMAHPARAIRALVDHRVRREAKVLDVLRAHGVIELDALLERVYDDVARPLHGMARRTLRAHLNKLAKDGRVGTTHTGTAWFLTDPAGPASRR